MAVLVPAIKAFFSSRFPLIVVCVPSIIYVLCIEYVEGVGYAMSYSHVLMILYRVVRTNHNSGKNNFKTDYREYFFSTI